MKIVQVAPKLPFAAFPGKWQSELFELLQDVYPAIEEVGDVLETGFMDINAVEHPAQIICNAGWLEHTRVTSSSTTRGRPRGSAG